MSAAQRGITVRAATLRDAEAIAALSAQLGYPSSEHEIRERLQIVCACRDDDVYVAQSPAGVVVGWVHVVQRQLLMTDRDAQIEGLVVEEGWRRKGIGRLLPRAVERWAIERSHTTIRVRSNVVRAGAHHFYESEGYDEVKRQIVYRRDLEQA